MTARAVSPGPRVPRATRGRGNQSTDTGREKRDAYICLARRYVCNRWPGACRVAGAADCLAGPPSQPV